MKNLNALFAVVFIISSAFVFLNEKATFTVDASKSEVHWYAKKVTGAHDGTVAVKSGSLELDAKNKLTGGSFVIDMTTIKVTDIDEANGAGKLEGHLNSADFFDVEKFKTAEFKITSVKKTGKQASEDKALEYLVKGDLTIKGIKNATEFKAYVKADGANAAARGTIKFDRTKFDIRYGSKTFFGSIGDKAIYDDVELKVSLKATK